MNPFRIAGLTCLAAAVVLLVLDVSLGLLHPTWQSISLARIIGMMSPSGLIALQDFVQNDVSSLLWNGILLPIISLPFWLTLAMVAVVLIAVGRNKAD
jgi:hypothetical protein